ncbi:MAG: folate-binding protein [Pigmentiphaga sp.]|uniref:CAF17-like 4Fe-4S cluster assembly/insertion protein YgfZ n=1 Tax=Pigmentiphaga sp. TaxID=1977564 RepID=UPI0029BE26BF|nr:folate-binding protein [Pigmentiphaga sp.]MDX3905426.1 folate-binding protein [Pigmentiphaga sp.]
MSIQEIVSPGIASGTASARLVRLDHLTVIEIRGADAIEFLHGQLTQDVKQLGDADAKPAGYCTAKGRLLASAIIWRGEPDPADPAPRVLAMIDASIAETLQKRLSMFVLRAKVKVSRTALQVAGIWSGTDSAALQAAAGGLLPAAPWTRAELPSGTWIAAPTAGAGQARWWWVGPADSLQRLCVSIEADAGIEQAWRAADIAAGLPWIVAVTQDMFVPQMVNFELIGGVSFTKGCYPGQEVVARSHYLGKLKRRMFGGRIATAEDPLALTGADVFQDGDEQPCGRIVNAARDGDAVAILYESTLTAAGGPAALRAGSAAGPVITGQALPYSVPDDAKSA